MGDFLNVFLRKQSVNIIIKNIKLFNSYPLKIGVCLHPYGTVLFSDMSTFILTSKCLNKATMQRLQTRLVNHATYLVVPNVSNIPYAPNVFNHTTAYHRNK